MFLDKQEGFFDIAIQRRPVGLKAEATASLFSLLFYIGMVVLLVLGMLVLSFVLGQRHRDLATGEPYESGIVSTGSARLRLAVKYYLVAVFFVVFDLEVAFIVAWAVAARELGWAGYLGMVVFVGVLLLGLAYLWRLGALDWDVRKRARTVNRCGGSE